MISEAEVAIFADRKEPANIYIRACHEFSKRTAKLDFSYSEHLANAPNLDAKEFFLERIIKEVLNASISMLNWCVQISELGPNIHLTSYQTFQPFMDTIFIQQNLCVRKLFEILIYCISFGTTNSPEYYQHLLLLFDLDQILGKLADRVEFFERPNQYQAEVAAQLRASILNLESATPSLATSWYIASVNNNRLHKKGLLKSVKDVYKYARPLATEKIKLTMGQTYQTIFGSTSKFVHFTPTLTYTSGKTTLNNINSYLGVQSLLIEEILLQCMKLSFRIPGSVCQGIKDANDAHCPEIDHIISTYNSPPIFIGNYVTCSGNIAKVKDIHVSSFELTSYLLTPLVGWYNKEDWFASADCALYDTENIMSEKEVIAQWKACHQQMSQ